MLFKHGILYVISRILPSALNFLAFAIYTRIVSPQEYGYFATAFAAIMLMNNLLFQWLRLGLLRFLPKFEGDKNRQIFLSSILTCYLLSTGVFILFLFSAFAGLMVFGITDFKSLILISAVVVIIYGWFEATLELMRSTYNPKDYGLLLISKTALLIACKSILFSIGFGASGLLIGLLLGHVLPLTYFTFKYWKGVSLKSIDKSLIKKILVYGLPLSITSLMVFIIDSSDRILIGWLLDSSATGLYAVGYDIAKQSIWILMLSVNLASFPLAVKALEKNGVGSAVSQLKSNFIFLAGIAIPGAIGLIIVSGELTQIFLGEEFSRTAVVLIPVVVIGIILAGFKSYYFDQSFQLGEKTFLQFWPVLVGAVLNILLNIWWIPLLGIMGAAYSTVISYAAGLVLSIIIGRNVFKLPFPAAAFEKIVTAGLMMGAFIYQIELKNIFLTLILKLISGVIIYLGFILILDVGNVREQMKKLLKLLNGYRIKTN
jgi:O-antigen/teichoic acid export membrane protein